MCNYYKDNVEQKTTDPITAEPLPSNGSNNKMNKYSTNKASFVSSTLSEKPSDAEEVEADYDADNDDDDEEEEIDQDYELNEIVIDSGQATTQQGSKKGVTASTTAAVSKKMRKIKCALGASVEKTNAVETNPNGKPPSQPDSTSSSESGFGTVDDDVDPNNHVNSNPTVIKLDQDKRTPSDVVIDMSALGKRPNQSSSTDTNTSQFPILQPPRQIVYELGASGGGRRHSDEIVNILNDHSSLNSSICSSSSSSTADKNCCTRLFSNLVKFYYSCFCCVSTTQDTSLMCCTWLSIFCCCCPLLAGVSLYFTKRSKRFKLKQKYELADKYSSWAEKLNIASLIIGIIFYAIAFFMITLVIFMYWRPHKS